MSEQIPETETRLRWQKGQPTQPGWYWVSVFVQTPDGERGYYDPHIIWLMDNGNVWLNGSGTCHVLNDIFDAGDGIADRFAGPIPSPAD